MIIARPLEASDLYFTKVACVYSALEFSFMLHDSCFCINSIVDVRCISFILDLEMCRCYLVT